MVVAAAASAAGKLVPAAILTTTAARFAATGLYELTAKRHLKGHRGDRRALVVRLAVYAAAAMALEDAKRQTLLPLGRRGVGAESIEGNLGGQLEHVEREAAVREQL